KFRPIHFLFEFDAVLKLRNGHSIIVYVKVYFAQVVVHRALPEVILFTEGDFQCLTVYSDSMLVIALFFVRCGLHQKRIYMLFTLIGSDFIYWKMPNASSFNGRKHQINKQGKYKPHCSTHFGI